MKIFSRYTLLFSALVIGAIGCTDHNDNIGDDYLRDDQETLIKYELFSKAQTPDGVDIFSFSKYENEDFEICNLSYGTTGGQYKENFGVRTSGFFSQFTPMYTLDDDEDFGTDPLIHSVLIYLPAAEFSGDTTIINKYKVYRVLNDDFIDDFIDDDDYLSMTGEDAASLFASDKLANTENFEHVFTFQFPDQANYVYTTSEALYLDYYDDAEDDGTEVTQAGIELIQQLILKEVDGRTKIDYTYYDFDNHDDFIDEFKGFYIEWVGATDKDGNEIDITAATTDKGATYSHLLSSCGFGITCYQDYDDWYTAEETDDGDTSSISLTAMVFSFEDSYSEYGGNSINYIARTEDTTNPADNYNNIYVEPLGGRVTEMRIKKSFFEYMDSMIDKANEDEENTDYINIYFNKACIKGYIPMMTGYDMATSATDIKTMTTEMNTMPSRIGMYLVYSHTYDDDGYSELETIYDYDTVSESYYGTTSVYDGYINRSMGYYEMNLQHQLQIMWAEWHALSEDEKESLTDGDLNDLDWNKIYIAPTTSNLATVKYATIQGLSDSETNGAPLLLEVIYTLRK